MKTCHTCPSLFRAARFFASVSAFSLPPLMPAAHAGEPALLPPVVVTAARHTTELATTPASVTVLDETDLARESARPLEDILMRHAGIAVGRNGGHGQLASLFMRGTESDHVLVLVDGIRMNGATISGVNLQNLRGADIRRIEIVRGPRSTLYGSEAMGGVISVTTRRRADTPDAKGDSLTLRGESGSDDTVRLHADAARFTPAGHVAFSAGRLRTDGDILVGTIPVTGAHDNTSHTFNASHRIGSGRVGIDAMEDRGTTQYVDTFAGTALHQDYRNGNLALWGSAAVGEAMQLDARVGQSQDHIDQQESADYTHSFRRSGALVLTHAGDSATIVAGAEAEREIANAVIYGAPTQDATDNRAIFLRDDLRFGRHALGVAVRETDYDSFGRHTTGDASWGLDIAAGTFGWIAWGRGFHAPTAVDRYGYGGNPALKPETSSSYEAGLRQRAGALTLTLTGFRQDIEELALCVALPPPSWDCVMQNIDSARITGTEFAADWQRDNTRAGLVITLLDPVDESTGEKLSRRPEKQLSATASHRLDRLELRVALTAMDRRDNSAYDAIQLPGFMTLDLGARWFARNDLRLDARIENAGDVHYALAASGVGPYHMPDRAYFLGVEWTPGK